jgi:hypothetical protein
VLILNFILRVTTKPTISHPHTHCESSPAIGLVPARQQPTPHQQTMQSQQGTAHSSPTKQVQPTTAQTTNCTPINSSGIQIYDNNFPALPDHTITSWTKVEYKKRPRDTPDTHKQSTKQPKLNNYWLNQPSTSTANKFEVLMEPEMDKTQSKT